MTAIEGCRVLAQRLGQCHAVFKFPLDIGRAIYTPNAIESLNAAIRHITANRIVYFLLA